MSFSPAREEPPKSESAASPALPPAAPGRRRRPRPAPGSPGGPWSPHSNIALPKAKPAGPEGQAPLARLRDVRAVCECSSDGPDLARSRSARSCPRPSAISDRPLSPLTSLPQRAAVRKKTARVRLAHITSVRAPPPLLPRVAAGAVRVVDQQLVVVSSTSRGHTAAFQRSISLPPPVHRTDARSSRTIRRCCSQRVISVSMRPTRSLLRLAIYGCVEYGALVADVARMPSRITAGSAGRSRPSLVQVEDLRPGGRRRVTRRSCRRENLSTRSLLAVETRPDSRAPRRPGFWSSSAVRHAAPETGLAPVMGDYRATSWARRR